MPLKIDKAAGAVDLDPRDDAFVQDPYAAYAELRQRQPVFYWQQYGFWCLTRFDDVNRALRERRFGRQVLHVTTRQALGWPEPDPRLAAFDSVERHSLLELEPPAHTRIRALIHRAFVAREVERLRPRIEALAHRLVDGFAGEVTDLLLSYATPLPVIVIAELLGIDPALAPQLLDWSHRMVAMYQARRSAADEVSANAAARDFAAMIAREVAARRTSPRDDLLTHLVTASSAEEPLSDDEIVSTAILLLNAGHEATVHAIGNGVKALIEHTQDPVSVLASPASAAATVEEILRFDPPLHMFTRYALDDIEAFGQRFKTGDKIGLLLGAANRDAARFEAPDRFDPVRPAQPHAAFGAGIHFCVGAPLARLEIEVALSVLLARLPRLALAAGPRYRDTYHFHGLEKLLVQS